MSPARAVIVLLLGVLLLTGGPVLSAAQFPRGLLERAAKGCVVETRPLTFGAYDPLVGTAVEALAEVIYTCGVDALNGDRGVKNIRIEMSRGASNSYDRAMTKGGDLLRYNVYLDAAHRTVWGDGTSNTDFYFDANPPNKRPVTVTAYGLIFPLQDVEAGSYVDSLQVTILF